MDKDYRVSNLYYMLSYAFNDDTLRALDTKIGSVESFKNASDLLAMLLYVLVGKLIKRGVNKEYISVEEELSVLKGRINVSGTLKRNGVILNKIICEFEDYSSNDYLNKIIKTTIMHLIRSNNISQNYKKKLKLLNNMFNDINQIEIYTIQWEKINYNKGNKSYKSVINLCYLILNTLIANENEGSIQNLSIDDGQVMHALFEKFIREYIASTYPHVRARIKRMKWNIDKEYMVDFIPEMVTDVTITHGNKEMIIDTKFYAQIFNTRKFDDKIFRSIDSGNWNQINAYVSNASYKSDKDISGMLLYAKTSENVDLSHEARVMGKMIYIRTIDMSKDFLSIEKEIFDIVSMLDR